jgi:hypothetical protein
LSRGGFLEPTRGSCEVKLLIAAGDTVSELSELPSGVRSLVDAASEIVVMSPSLTGRLNLAHG